MSDNEIKKRLENVLAVKTGSMGVRNEVVHVGEDRVTVRSERTARDREVTYDQLRNAANESRNGVIVRVLAQVVGL
ncbi:MAG: hypothetical protein Q8Q52_01910 [Acidimicrobiia bacterium]|nr:hypothetical protein [Acidimicrobiia bacterium]